MIEYLEQLVEDRKYQEAVKLGEQLLTTVQSPDQLVRIHEATVIANSMLGQFEATLAGGESTLDLARELEAWDSFGTVALWVGIAYGFLGQHQESIDCLYQYLGSMHLYNRAAVHEAYAWYNLGIAQAKIGQPHEAAKSFYSSLAVATRRGELRFAHGVRQALIKSHLETGYLEPIPRLLTQCGHYLRRFPDVQAHKASWAHHMKFRGEYALATGRPNRAETIATRALVAANGDLFCEFLMHALLAVIASKQERSIPAVGHAMAARTCAVMLRRADLETEANNLIYTMVRPLTVTEEGIGRYYAQKLL